MTDEIHHVGSSADELSLTPRCPSERNLSLSLSLQVERIRPSVVSCPPRWQSQREQPPSAGIHRVAIRDPRTLHFSAMVVRHTGNGVGNNAKISSNGATSAVPLAPHNPFLPSALSAT